MAWPPPTLPIDRTNALPQQDTHPSDHNAANLAINDLVTKVLSIVKYIPEHTQYGSGVIATSANGDGYIPFAVPFAAGSLPNTVLTMEDPPAGLLANHYRLYSDNTRAAVRVTNFDNTVPTAGAIVRMSYIAMGTTADPIIVAQDWPWGSGTDEDPYYTPPDYVFGSSIDDYLSTHGGGGAR